MQPFYFGTSQEQLFGVYHAPEGRAVRNGAVLLCHPLGHEYLRAHRAFRNLAATLASQGFHVLRFDYFGTGDSSGDAEQTTVARCLADLADAIQELKDISGASKVSLVGLRLGATFAAFASVNRRDIDRIVLWDPVSDGKAYVNDLLTLHRSWLEDRLGPSAAAECRDRELIGLPLTDTIRRELEAAKLAPLPALGASRVYLIVSEAHMRYRPLYVDLQASKIPLVCHVIPGGGEWENGELVHQILLPHAMIRAISTVMNS